MYRVLRSRPLASGLRAATVRTVLRLPKLDPAMVAPTLKKELMEIAGTTSNYQNGDCATAEEKSVDS